MLNSLVSLARRPDPESCPQVLPPAHVPTSCPKVRARRPVRVFRLVAEPLRPAQIHARALLRLIAEETPDAIGQWVLKSDLEIVYRQLAEREGWAAFHWNRIAAELGRLTRKRTVKNAGKRHVAYLLPRG